ncbi:MAG: hypothetical protein QG670_493 [Thermoproteota archaeon]|nr:hypothetical protein [Thermoproteota archaeon]
MSTPDARKLYVSRLDTINNQVSSLMIHLNEFNRRVTGIDDALNRLPTRIQQIRKMNYRVMINLENDIDSLSKEWATAKPGVANLIESTVPALTSEGRNIENELGQKRFSSNSDVAQLGGIEFRVSTLNARVSDLAGRVSGFTGGIMNRFQSLDADVGIAERTLNLSSGSSFQWKENESPIISVNAKDLNNDVEGILSLTSQRFLFESQKEVVLKKTLFIATQKKKVRETMVDKPVGIVDSIVKGRVGILSGQGLYITFKPNSGQQEMKLDTKGDDTDLVIRFHQLISSGEADLELDKIKGPKTDEQKSIPLVCPRCGAPYTAEIYRGQTSLQCKYCSTAIPISR